MLTFSRADQIRRTLSLASLDNLLALSVNASGERDKLLAEVSKAGKDLVWRPDDEERLFPRDGERAVILAAKRGIRAFIGDLVRCADNSRIIHSSFQHSCWSQRSLDVVSHIQTSTPQSSYDTPRHLWRRTLSFRCHDRHLHLPEHAYPSSSALSSTAFLHSTQAQGGTVRDAHLRSARARRRRGRTAMASRCGRRRGQLGTIVGGAQSTSRSGATVSRQLTSEQALIT